MSLWAWILSTTVTHRSGGERRRVAGPQPASARWDSNNSGERASVSCWQPVLLFRSLWRRKVTREVLIGRRRIVCRDLGQEMNQVFNALFAEFFIAGSWSIVDSVEFRTAAWDFFDKANGSLDHNAFFETVSVICDRLVESNQQTSAEQLWQKVIELADKWESRNAPRRVHKGTPYYFWGQSALERGDLDCGYSLIHQAFLEDRSATQGKLPDLPALALITLNINKIYHAIQPWVKETSQVLERALAQYRSAYAKPLTYPDLHKRFLERPDAIESIFLLGYTVARLERLGKLPPYLQKSEFGGQLCLNLLFDLLLVIDSATKPYSRGKYFSDHAEFIAKTSGMSMTRNNLLEANSASNADVEKCVQDLLDQKLSTPSGFVFVGIERDVALSYVLRNTGAHSLIGLPAIGARMNDILQSAFNMLFLVVELLY
jgi:hypothetical protein